MFVGLMLKSVIVSLFILSTLMLHNTILLGVEQKKYNLSILKLLGADRKFVAYKILRQSLKTVLTANVIAYPLVFVAFQVIELLIKESIGYHVSVGFTLHSFIVGISIGFLVPVCASIFPIVTILNNDLAKDLSHRPQHYSETKTEIYVEGS
jgi:ABC-type antimicrobial peptide transport system permease subunit